jgi:hypothetical protein
MGKTTPARARVPRRGCASGAAAMRGKRAQRHVTAHAPVAPMKQDHITTGSRCVAQGRARQAARQAAHTCNFPRQWPCRCVLRSGAPAGHAARDGRSCVCVVQQRVPQRQQRRGAPRLPRTPGRCPHALGWQQSRQQAARARLHGLVEPRSRRRRHRWRARASRLACEPVGGRRRTGADGAHGVQNIRRARASMTTQRARRSIAARARRALPAAVHGHRGAHECAAAAAPAASVARVRAASCAFVFPRLRRQTPQRLAKLLPVCAICLRRSVVAAAAAALAEDTSRGADAARRAVADNVRRLEGTALGAAQRAKALPLSALSGADGARTRGRALPPPARPLQAPTSPAAR